MEEKTGPDTTLKPTTRPSLAGRAVLAVLLTIGFYGLALAIVFALLFVVYSEFVFLKRIELRITVLCLLGAGTILWSILPRFDSFQAPGPRLLPEKHPKLHALIAQVAEKMGQKMPSEVYLLLDFNAFVAERGGLMGLGSRRVMGIGLPMLQALTLPELQAVLAHEFGHFYGGDTRLGPWIYRTREAILRTVGNLGNSILRVPFESYAKLFLRITQAISRRQELVADEMAARAYGSRAVISGLRAVETLGAAHTEYLRSEVGPVLKAGFRPPLAEGFSMYIHSPEITAALANYAAHQAQNAKTNVYDSHPSIPDRIQAVESFPPGPDNAASGAAISLIENVGNMELRLLAVAGGKENARNLKPVSWQDVGENVYRVQWLEMVKDPAPTLRGLTPARTPELLKCLNQIFVELKIQNSQQFTPVQKDNIAQSFISVALCALLVNAGWQVEALPGMDARLYRGEDSFCPFAAVHNLNSGNLKVDDWLEECQRLGISELHF